MKVKLHYHILLLFMTLTFACAGGHRAGQIPSTNVAAEDHRTPEAFCEKVQALQQDLAALDRQADLLEAKQVAETAITYSNQLAKEYRLVRPPVLHNVLIRVGLKDRGLCYHWTEDLLQQLQSLDLRTYQIHWGVAYRGSELREHNSVVITGKGQAFEQGIVLDPWRNSGELYWALIKIDRYPWQELPPSDW